MATGKGWGLRLGGVAGALVLAIPALAASGTTTIVPGGSFTFPGGGTASFASGGTVAINSGALTITAPGGLTFGNINGFNFSSITITTGGLTLSGAASTPAGVNLLTLHGTGTIVAAGGVSAAPGLFVVNPAPPPAAAFSGGSKLPPKVLQTVAAVQTIRSPALASASSAPVGGATLADAGVRLAMIAPAAGADAPESRASLVNLDPFSGPVLLGSSAPINLAGLHGATRARRTGAEIVFDTE